LVQDYVPAAKFFFVAEVDKQIVGCCALEIYSRKIAEIRSLSVHSDFQGQGIATALVSACVKRAEKKKIKEVLAITGAVKLFEKSGFSTLQHEKYALLKMLA
jgi:amino-acid N-acetyltransferase